MHITVDAIMAAGPCAWYPRKRVESLWAGCETLTPAEVAALDIPVKDRLWAIIYCAMDDRQRRHLACDCTERLLARVDEPDQRSVEAVAVARRYADGLATDKEFAAARDAAKAAWAVSLDAAACAACAAWAAYYSASERDVARNALGAAWYAANLADIDGGAAARDAEREWQLQRALEYVEGKR